MLSDKEDASTFALSTTCVFNVDVNVAVGTSLNAVKSNSSNNETKALLTGAKTVNGAGSVPFGVDNIST